jgi:hypothetical protein
MKPSSTSRRPSERRRRQVQVPVLPVDPTIGGKDGNPGAVLRFNKKLLVNNVEEACRKAEKTKPTNERSVEEIVFLLPSGKIIITDLFLTSLSLPLCLVDLMSPNILNWYTNGGRLAAYGSWVYIESSAPSVNYTGQLYVPPTPFSADLNTSIGRTDDNKPAVNNTDCIVELGESKMSFSSSSPKAREAIGKIEPNVTELISEALEITMCDLISYVLHSAVNNILSSFRTKIQLWDVPNVSLDYSLIADPIVDPVDLSISALLKGSMTVDNADVSIYPHDMASIGNNSKMVVTLFSDFVLNSLLASAYQADLLRKIIFDSTYSNKMAEYLKLECPLDKLHVGAVFPCNGSKASAEISLSFSQAPSVIFLEGNGFMQMNGSICLHLVNASSSNASSSNASSSNASSKVMIYMSPFSMIASLKPSLREEKLYNMIAMDASVLELKLNSTTVEASKRDKLIQLMSAMLEEIVNKPLNYGIPVPMFLNNQMIKLRNYDLSFRNRTLVLAQNPM